MDKCPCCGLFSAMFFAFIVLFVGDCCFKWSLSKELKSCLVWLSSRRLMCLTGKIHVLVKLCSGTSYSAVGYEFDFNESTIFIK